MILLGIAEAIAAEPLAPAFPLHTSTFLANFHFLTFTRLNDAHAFRMYRDIIKREGGFLVAAHVGYKRRKKHPFRKFNLIVVSFLRVRWKFRSFAALSNCSVF